MRRLLWNPGQWFRGFPAGTRGKIVISGGAIPAIMFGSDWTRENPATGYDHHSTASTFLPFFRVFPPGPARTLSPEKDVDVSAGGCASLKEMIHLVWEIYSYLQSSRYVTLLQILAISATWVSSRRWCYIERTFEWYFL